MAAAAVATPSHVFSQPAPVQGVTARPSNNDVGYTDPTTAPKTKTYPLANKLTPKPAGSNQLYKQKGVTYGDWRDDLVRDAEKRT